MINIIYPQVCGICDKINKKYLCKQCEIQLKKYLINEIIDCTTKKELYFDNQVKVFEYKNIVRKKIIEYKFHEKTYLYKTLEKIIINNENIYSFLKKYDIIMPVPMYRAKRWERGYNQTELIAKELSKSLNIIFNNKNLNKIKDTKKQSTLNKKERTINVKDAFEISNADDIKDKKIILFDDIYTTGSTVNECSKVLKQAGAKEIAILTIAVD